ncbi:MAG: M28 family peptidase [Acidobacteriia bacterium]|nr:M28 family peptidase [Terriglobia bacterium]
MPLHSYAGARGPLTAEESVLRDRLASHVRKLAGGIGERNIAHYASLVAAGEYLETALTTESCSVKSQTFSVDGKAVRNLEIQIKGSRLSRENVIVGAHYDSAPGTPGADDNASGVAAILELARLLKSSKPGRTIRLVLFVNEEPPYFQTGQMGSLVYARRLRQENVAVTSMLSLETIGYYSDSKGSQHYPPGLASLYPDTGNFIGFVGDVGSRPLVQRAIKAFRESAEFPSEAVAAPSELTGIGWSDHWSFWQAGYQGVMVTDTAPFRYPYYHKAPDKPEELDYDRMARVVGGLQKVILKLANE